MKDFDEVTSYPLCWPTGRPRTPDSDKRASRFRKGLSVAAALDDLFAELGRLDVDDWNVIVSTNVELRRDGLPKSGRRNPDDPGVAVYFRLNDEPLVFACDKWPSVPHNLRAITLHIEATRALERWGVGSLREAFAGYKALPSGDSNNEEDHFAGCRTTHDVQERFRELVKIHHPDKGGNTETMAEINRQYPIAREQAWSSGLA